MSTEAYARATGRESKFWKPFLYSFPFNDSQSADRVVIYGLYSNSYLNQQGYLIEIESTDLSNMLNDYNTKLAELSTAQQVVVADVVSKRYLASIEKIIHDQKMVTKSSEISAEDAAWTAKTAALAADRAALDTMAAKVTIETEKTTARVTELEAYIAIEGYNLSEVDIQIAEKEIQSAKVDIDILNTTNEVLKIQIETVEAALRLIDVDLQIADTKIRNANTERDIVKIDLLANDLAIEKGRTQIAQAELPIAEERVVLAEAKSKEVDNELTYYEKTLIDQAATAYSNKVDLMNEKEVVREDELLMRQEEKELEISNRLAVSALDITFANLDSTQEDLINARRVAVMETQVVDVQTKVNAAIEVAQTLAAAKITSELTHTVQKKT